MEEHFIQLLNACKFGSLDALRSVCEDVTADLAALLNTKDEKGRTPLHYVVALDPVEGKTEEMLDMLLASGASCTVDNRGNTALHFATRSPMTSYQIAKALPEACLIVNSQGCTPIDLGVKYGTGEVLNAMLLACAGNNCKPALEAMKVLMEKGAVCDTWAPTGSSALMLAAASDSPKGIKLLLANGASIELQDALGRTALMFAAGSGAQNAVTALLEAGASVAARDRRGRNVMHYANESPEAKAILDVWMKEMEQRAAKMQEALLEELMQEEAEKTIGKASKKAKKKAKGKKKGSENGQPLVGTDSPTCPGHLSASAAASAPENEVLPPATSPKSHMRDEPDTEIYATNLVSLTLSPVIEPLSLDEGAEGVVSRDDGLAPRPQSPEWHTVVKHHHPGKHQPTTHTNGSRTRSQSPTKHSSHTNGHHHHSHHHDRIGKTGGMLSSHRRCPSSSSLGSACSGESQDTNVSSERCVLRRHSGTARPSSLNPGQQNGGGKAVALPAVVGADPVAFTWAKVAAAGNVATPRMKSLAEESECKSTKISAESAAVGGGAKPPSIKTSPVRQTNARHVKVEHKDDHMPSPSLSSDHDHTGQASSLEPSSPCGSLPAGGSSDKEVLVLEVQALRAHVAQLRREQAAAAMTHHMELAAVLQDAVQHESEAVERAVAEERMRCVLRFASMLQNDSTALALALPKMLGTTPAQDTINGSTSQYTLDQQQQQQQRMLLGQQLQGVCPENVLNNAGIGLGPGSLDSAALAMLGFPPLSPPTTQGYSSSPLDMPQQRPVEQPEMCIFNGSPLSSSPYSLIDLREEFLGNHSSFVMPAGGTSGNIAKETQKTFPLADWQPL